ncbi:MAG: SUF system NifU family Fe-S cluster assembly protein [bacterium]|nr:SUF system NifU family Fe-S cluster assembly protein [Candidatus Sumerlaeota bacterium]
MGDLRELYQEVILDHNKCPRNCRRIDNPTCEASGYNPLCGDKITVFLTVSDRIIKDVSFEGSGCAISTASASMMTQALKGKTVDEALKIFGRFHDLVTGKTQGDNSAQENLGKLAVFTGVSKFPVRVKCASLAWHTLKSALDGSSETVTTE